MFYFAACCCMSTGLLRFQWKAHDLPLGRYLIGCLNRHSMKERRSTIFKKCTEYKLRSLRSRWQSEDGHSHTETDGTVSRSADCS